MYDSNKLRGAIYAAGKTPYSLASEIKMVRNTFYRKLKTGAWGLDEAKAIAEACKFTKKQSVDIFLS